MVGRLSAILFLASALAPAQSNSVLLFSECSDSSQVKRILQTTDAIEVRHSLVGNSQPCYAVSVAASDGNMVDGYLIGTRHPAVIAYERTEQAYIAQALPHPPEASPNHAKAPARPKHYARKLWNPFGSHAGTK